MVAKCFRKQLLPPNNLERVAMCLIICKQTTTTNLFHSEKYEILKMKCTKDRSEHFCKFTSRTNCAKQKIKKKNSPKKTSHTKQDSICQKVFMTAQLEKKTCMTCLKELSGENPFSVKINMVVYDLNSSTEGQL